MLKKFWMLIVCTALLLNTGCSVYMAANQPGLKNVELLRVGTSRDLLVSEFGEPVSSGVDGDGREYDKFSFVQGYSSGAKAGRVIFHVVADVLTHGLWELLGTPLEATFDGDKITYEITYDRNDRIAQIIKFENVSSSIARTNYRIISSLKW
ncbi:MAG: hypothetical protein GQ541_03135 [Desulfovibrionaceae bacterium]|jgi:hypothetical protein|nr:hypothetical protein [Desulfovibrionaceae bacterium]